MNDLFQAFSVVLSSQTDFDGWRNCARAFCARGIAPGDVTWSVAGGKPANDSFVESRLPSIAAEGIKPILVPRLFIDKARIAICHRDEDRFAFLHRCLSRLQHDRDLLRFSPDPDVRRLDAMEKAVRRDSHKMHAFVRFREVVEESGPRFVAWFEPEHFIVSRNAEFFIRRFTGMNWSILTPHECMHWDGDNLTLSPGASRAEAPTQDASEDLWLTYFRNIFNPARLKIKAMQAEMPKKYWRNMPEASLISELIAGAESATRSMLGKLPTVPPRGHEAIRNSYWRATKESVPSGEPLTLAALRERATTCELCQLHCGATQTVFGEGAEDAPLMFVGEQPGDIEDLQGQPFVGPAGKILQKGLVAANIDRASVYLTNAVKHFKNEPKGRARIHKRPNTSEIQKCKWWLDREIAFVRPRLIVALGATAAYALTGEKIAVSELAGSIIQRDDGLHVLYTRHPASLLRLPDRDIGATETAKFHLDLAKAKHFIEKSSAGHPASALGHI